jgi:hypothetical protein
MDSDREGEDRCSGTAIPKAAPASAIEVDGAVVAGQKNSQVGISSDSPP